MLKNKFKKHLKINLIFNFLNKKLPDIKLYNKREKIIKFN